MVGMAVVRKRKRKPKKRRMEREEMNAGRG
jgi:hypothetical protein